MTRRGRTGSRLSAGAALACALAALASGCGAGDDGAATGRGHGAATADTGAGRRAADPGLAAGRMSEEEFVSTVAALSVAAGEGLSGADALRRVVALGAPPFRRDEVESFAAGLRDDPHRWVRLALAIEDRAQAIEAGLGAPPPTEAASRPSR